MSSIASTFRHGATLVARYRVAESPSLVVIPDRALLGRLDRPTGSRQIAEFLEPWLG